MNESVLHELIELYHNDEKTRARLAEEGVLFDGYAGEMEQVHNHNAQQLESIINEFGWPGESLVGEDGTWLAWMIAEHAIGLPDFQRRCLELLKDAVKNGEAPAIHAAYLTDRIRFNERKPQVYGTIFDWDEHGQLNPWTIEDQAGVDERRANVGLSPLVDAVEDARKQAAAEGNAAPADYKARQWEIEEWARRVGWTR
ncbi:MAG: hypothetical protein JSW71_01560 [Gemmatimonadota bacterium]|nr:MAG: hypothetical protein JSW71_01560 [Gemmatimonadota bacterium]